MKEQIPNNVFFFFENVYAQLKGKGGTKGVGGRVVTPSTAPLDLPLITGRAKRTSFAAVSSLTLDHKSPTRRKAVPKGIRWK